MRVAAGAPAMKPYFPAVFLPLAGGYLVSYVFRTINGPLSAELIQQFSLNSTALGLLTSIYFLAFTLSAIPIGMALDVFGPRRVQACLMTVATLGAVGSALAPNALFLMIGRALIGIGVAGALMAGLKANALWVSPRYLPFANGGIVMFGGFGAIIATLPIGVLDADLGWRNTFLILAAVSLTVAIAVFVFLPKQSRRRAAVRHRGGGLIEVVVDRRFLRIAPLSASVIGSAFAIQGLWAARWLVDVDGFDPATVLDVLLAMGVGLTVGSLLIGGATSWVCRFGIAETKIFAILCASFVAAQLALLMNARLPAALLWGVLGAIGGMSVLSYSILDSIFPSQMVGRTNSVLNVLHLASAWIIQAVMGFIIDEWPVDVAGHYPVIAYQAAFALPVALQVLGLIWFAHVSPESGESATHGIRQSLQQKQPSH
jgi:predicted MFS family arabinose efflux permease